MLRVRPLEKRCHGPAAGRHRVEIAYSSDDSGRSEVYAVAMAGGSRVQVSVDGGSGPLWSRNGRELFCRSGDRLVSVGVSTEKGLSLGTPVTLLDLADYDPGFFYDFDVSADGQRFAVIRTEPAARPVRLDVIINWFEELKTKFAGEGATR